MQIFIFQNLHMQFCKNALPEAKMSKKTVEDSWGNGGRPRTFSKSMVSKSKKLIYDDCFCFGLGLIRLISNGGARGVRSGCQEYILRTPQEYTLPGVRLPPEEYLLPGRSTPGNPIDIIQSVSDFFDGL